MLLGKPGAVEAANAKSFLVALLEVEVPCESPPQGLGGLDDASALGDAGVQERVPAALEPAALERVPAALEAKARAVKLALAAGLDPNRPGGKRGGTPLFALCSDALGTVTYDGLLDDLLARGADPNLAPAGCYALVPLAGTHADQSCRARMLDRLLGADPSPAVLRALLTRLVDAADFEHLAINEHRFRVLVRRLDDKHAPEPRIVSMAHFDGATLLHRAVLAANFRAVELLLEQGLDAEVPLPRSVTIRPSHTADSDSTAGRVPRFSIRAGSNALDLARGCGAAAAQALTTHGLRIGHDSANYLELEAQIAELLAARGVEASTEGPPAVTLVLSEA